MSNNQLSLEQAASAIKACVPAGWHVLAQYLIASDGVVFRIQDAERRRHVDLPRGSPSELYQSMDGLAESRKADIDAAVIQLMSISS